jgi:hypothetical protein
LQKPLIEMQRQPRGFRRLSGCLIPQRKKPDDQAQRQRKAANAMPKLHRAATAIGINLEGPEFGQDRYTRP